MRGGRLLAGLVAVIAVAASAPSLAAAATGCDTRSYHAPQGRMHLSVRSVGSFNGYVPGATAPGRYRVVKRFEVLALYAQFDVVAAGGHRSGGADVTFPVTRAARKLLPGAALTVPVMGSGGRGATAQLTLWRLRGAYRRVLVARQTVSMGAFSKRVTTSEDAFYLLELRTGTTTKTAVLTTISPCAIDGTGTPMATIGLSTTTAVPISKVVTTTAVSFTLYAEFDVLVAPG